MKQQLLLFMLAILGCSTMKAADGDTFTTNTIEGITMSFKVLSESQKTCQVKSSSSSYGSASINKATTGTVTVPSEVNGYSVKVVGKYAFYGCSNLTIVNLPSSITEIAEEAFKNCTSLASISIPQNVTTIGLYAFLRCSSLLSINIPKNVTSISNTICAECSSLESITVEEGNTVFDSRNNCNGIIRTATNSLFQGCKNTIIPEGIVQIDQAFDGCVGLISIIIPASVTSMYDAFVGCDNLVSVTALADKPYGSPNFSNKANATLYVPKGCVPVYEASYQWSGFKEIKEIKTADEITMTANGMATYCSTHALDFSGTDGIKAYIVSAFKPSTGEVTLTRITDVPANTGIIVKGDANSYPIPWGSGETLVSNMLVGVTGNTVLNKEDGENTNYILAKKNGVLGFYAVTDGSTLSAGKAYLPLPTASLPSGAREMKLVFDDEETTGIKETINNCESIGKYYDLQGRYIAKPTHGLYIVNGKKVIQK